MAQADGWPAGRWTQEHLAEGEMHCHRIDATLHRAGSGLQTIEVVETGGYGRGLFLDGRVQHVEADEYIYSEAIVHPPAVMLGARCRRVLVVGGGPGGVVREALRHRGVESVVQVEIDAAVLDLCRTWFAHVAQGCYDDPRVEVVIADIRDFARRTDRRFDLVVNDISEPMEGTPAAGLFEAPMLDALASLLSPEGVFVTWAGSAGPRSDDLARAIDRAVSDRLPHTARWLCHPQAYGTSWLTVAGSHAPLDPWRLSAAEIDAWLAARVAGETMLYDGETHVHMFSLPKDVRRRLATRDAGPAVLKVGPATEAAR
ncbi:hypothetical protein [Salinarimonas chemoclinalis]|uniref:spermine/spermidine synthase domain-containing protein n=1 Tax=Salinarimonas chemoclinalis TaxID=3241599 RepID=UPI003557A4CE